MKMLSTMRSSWLLFALLAIIALASAFRVEDALHIDGINAYLHHGAKRQADGTGAPSSEPAPPSTSNRPPPPSSTDEPQPSEPTPDPETSSTPAPSPSDDPTPSQERSTSARPPPPSTSTPGAPPPSSTAEAPPERTLSAPVVRTSAQVSTELQQITTIISYVSNGQTIESTSTSLRSLEHTTGTALLTGLPTPTAESSEGGGLSDTNKKVIGGVIGGVGGAILLGGIAIVCWRMWGRKNRVSEDDADLMAGTGAALGDKPPNAASPFQSNLEQYHNPGGRPNAAANF